MNTVRFTKSKNVMSFSAICIALVIGLVMLSIGIYLIINTQSKLNAYTKTTAVVVDYQRSGNRGDYTYAEIAEFTVNGKTYTVTNNVYSNLPADIGTELEIAYNPDNPNECVFVGSNNFFSFGFTIFAGIFTIIVLVVFVIEIIRMRKRRNSQTPSQYTQYQEENNIIL